MNRIIVFIFISLNISCKMYTDRPIERIVCVRNFTSEAIYVQYSYKDSLQLQLKLELFYYLSDRIKDKLDPYCPPEYRIEPHNLSLIAEKYDYEERWNPFPNNPEINYVNFFFIKESTMKNYTWEEIVAKQLYEKKVRYTFNQLEKMNYEISYNP